MSSIQYTECTSSLAGATIFCSYHIYCFSLHSFWGINSWLGHGLHATEQHSHLQSGCSTVLCLQHVHLLAAFVFPKVKLHCERRASFCFLLIRPHLPWCMETGEMLIEEHQTSLCLLKRKYGHHIQAVFSDLYKIRMRSVKTVSCSGEQLCPKGWFHLSNEKKMSFRL